MNKEKQKLVPELRFPKFKNDSDWKEVPLIGVTDKNVNWSFTGGPFGSNLKSSDYVVEENGIRIIQLQNIGDGEFKNKYKIFTSKEKADELLSCNIYPGDIIMSKMGDPVGRACLIPDFHDRYVMGSDGIRIVVDENKYDKYFIYLIINSKIFRSKVERSSTGSTRKRIGLLDLKKLTLFVPKDKVEQQKIANCLSSLDILIKVETDKLAKIKDHKKGLLQQLFPTNGNTKPQYRFPEFKNDEDWEESTIGATAKFRRGSFPQPYGRAEWYDDENGMPFIQVYDVDFNLKIKPKTKKRISQLGAKQSIFIEKGTVIVTLQGSIGRVAITQYDAYIDRTLLLFEEFFKPIDKLFFAYVIQLLFEIEKERAPGGIIKTITKEVLTSFNIYIPSILEQQKIAHCLLSVDELIKAQTEKVKALKKHKKGLMQQLFPNVNELAI